MRVFARSLMALAVVLSFAACGRDEAGSPAAASPAPTGTAPAAPSSDGSAEFGVAECDNYVRLYLACIDRMPEAARAQARQAVEQTKASWKMAASTDQGRAALATTCKMATDTSAASMRAYGCSW